MAGNRKEAEAFILTQIGKFIPKSENADMYRKYLSGMNDKQFEAFIDRLESGEEILSIVTANLAKEKLQVQNLLDMGKALGHEFFERLWLTDPVTGTKYLTPKKYLVMDLVLRRQIQLLVKKMSVAKDSKHTDVLTAQATGVSRGSKLSFPELQILYAQGMEKSILEFIKFRGGDTQAFNAMNRSIIDTGGFRQDSVAHLNSKVKSTVTLGVIFDAMHLANTVSK